jgi:hypothetical protein
VDDEDFEWASQFKWNAHHRLKGPELWYAARKVPLPNGRYRGIYMHREIAIRAGLPPSRRYDHKDNDGLNNRRNNIRPCTQSQNMANGRKSPGKSSQFKGVSRHPQVDGWRVRVGPHYIGFFTDEIEAALAYNATAKEMYGEFARLNDL